ncbi:hypothetical protein Patl1_30880 [Pistacia atlantica]|uniref:Uncharacterized protein n=1 Tax=Pistacia atlantica TaxID=434234 RepID=A0ACC1AEM1_9ROSI|nr:hypothetical protein Patl1_30880 [Pistacia atlantica]
MRKVRSVARFLQARMEPELAVSGRVRHNRSHNHQVLSWPY